MLSTSRVVAFIVTPLLTAVAGGAASLGAKYGLHVDSAEVTTYGIAAATAVTSLGLKWLHGSSLYERADQVAKNEIAHTEAWAKLNPQLAAPVEEAAEKVAPVVEADAGKTLASEEAKVVAEIDNRTGAFPADAPAAAAPAPGSPVAQGADRVATVTLQAELSTEERAIRHLIGEQKALASELAVAEAKAKLLETRIHASEVKKPEAPAVPAIPSGLRFPDVSSYQPRVQLADVRHATELIQLVHIDAAPLVVVKATEGIDYVDAYLATRWHGMAEAGFGHRGAYCFLHPSVASGDEQAEHFLAAITAGGREIHAADILIADAEVTDGCTPAQVAQCVATFGAYVMAHAPAKRWLYTGGPFAEENGLQLAPYDGHWLPAYVPNPAPYYVAKWGKPVAWQFTDGVNGPTPHAVTGIGACDCSIIL